MTLQNKIAMITDGARNIGKSIALRLTNEKAVVSIIYSQSNEAFFIKNKL